MGTMVPSHPLVSLLHLCLSSLAATENCLSHRVPSLCSASHSWCLWSRRASCHEIHGLIFNLTILGFSSSFSATSVPLWGNNDGNLSGLFGTSYSYVQALSVITLITGPCWKVTPHYKTFSFPGCTLESLVGGYPQMGFFCPLHPKYSAHLLSS